MKRFLVVLCAGMAAFFASCNDEETGKETKWFYAPEAGVSGTTVEVSCRTKFGDGVLTEAARGSYTRGSEPRTAISTPSRWR
ncbi:MAG: hypothetical protein ACLRM8_00835 [Alistipes sp.]